jgi:F-type H+-transporting ATPase subunit b
MLEVNSTLLIQIFNFLLLIFLLNLLLFKPIRGILAKRNNEMTGMDRTIRDYEDRALHHENGIEQGTVLARKEGFQEKERLKEEGIEGEKSLLKDANSSVEARINQAKKELESKLAGMKESLDEQVSVFSKEFAEKVLGRNIQ